MKTTQRDKRFQELFDKAHKNGMTAGNNCTPRPMIVGSPTSPFGNDIDKTKKVYKVEGGVCGFAWVHFAGNMPFGRWAKKKGLASKDYPNGLCVWVREFGQSMTRKEAYADAFAKILRDEGNITAYARSRMD